MLNMYRPGMEKALLEVSIAQITILVDHSFTLPGERLICKMAL